MMWNGFIWHRITKIDGFYEHCNKPSGSIEDDVFLDYLSILVTSQDGLCYFKLVN
jgi:hypothetical protein